MTWEEPEDGVPPPTHLSQQGQSGLPWPEGSLLLGLLHQGLVSEDGLKLITGNSDNKHAEENRLHDEQNTVEYSGLLQTNILGAFCTLCVPRPGH